MAIDTNIANQTAYQEGFNFLQGEFPARLLNSNLVVRENISGETYAFDWIGNVEARKITGNVVKIGFDNIELTKRHLSADRYVITLPIDDRQKRKMRKDPTGAFMRRCKEAFDRQMERTVIIAAKGLARVGKLGTATVDLTTDGGFTVDASAAGLTYEKLTEVKQKQSSVAKGSDFGQAAGIIYTDVEQKTAMSETELTSGDFDKLYTRDDKGRLTYALGMEVYQYPSAGNLEPMLPVVGGVRQCLALTEDAVTFGIEKAPMIEMLDLKNQYYETEAVNITGTFGAVRNEGSSVVLINTKI